MKTEDLTQSELNISTFFEMTPDLVCIAHRNGFFKKVNQAVIDKLGYTEAELMASPISSFIHPEDKQCTALRRTELLKGKNLLNFQNRYVAKSGTVLWLEWTSIYFSDGEVVFAIAKDITERKQIEIEIEKKYRKFKSLASHFKSSIEEDRKYLANELHEELAQLASVLRTDIDWVKSNAFELAPASKSKIEHASLISQLLIRTIRRISFSISPNMLEHLGLDATLDWYCKEFSILNGLPCCYESAYDETMLTDEIRIDLFRICQECLMNVSGHAQASHVKVSIEGSGDRIQLVVLDDGKGFDVKQQKRKPGFTRMRERAVSVNGELTIQSEPGKGTRVCVSIGRL